MRNGHSLFRLLRLFVCFVEDKKQKVSRIAQIKSRIVLAVFGICLFLQLKKKITLMTTFALNNLWTYLKGLSLTQSEREWLANKLIMPKDSVSELSAEERKAEFLKMAGIWSESEEGEEYYQMMKHRNDGRPANREVNLDD